MQADRRPSVQFIHDNECEELLRSHRWGRLAVQVVDHPEVFPLNYAMDGHRIVFRIDRGAKLASLRQNHIASFQIDEVDEEQRCGWSVMAVGPISEAIDAGDIERLEGLGLESWVTSESNHWMQLSPHRLSGRRLVQI
jgi:nitroimidazol reductase NimA-like FMN-containing flavoprotein (pyridoxamine 5'-phosphate oxidase superfamily)